MKINMKVKSAGNDGEKHRSPILKSAGLLAAATTLLAGCDGSVEVNTKPAFVGVVSQASYDGISDDLLTAGLGKTGLQSATQPAVVDPLQPTSAEIRRLAIYNNYRALVDIAPAGGYGTLYGPNVTAAGAVTTSEGLVAGTEYLAFADDGSGRKNVTMAVQIPASFDGANPCIVTAPSSGSRGVYGAIATSGEWGLKKGCAVAYTDKGSGMGVDDLQNDTVNLIDGRRAPTATAGNASNFTAALSASALAAFNAIAPNRFAVKHAHSQQNPEKDWGTDTLHAISFAFYALNQQFGAALPDGQTHLRRFRPENTLVIAAGVSNGGGAALAAAEQDTDGLIDGVAVAEPQIQLKPNAGISVQRGALVRVGTGRTLYDYFTVANLYQPCASLSAAAVGSPGLAFVSATNASNRCAALAANGLLSATTLAGQADESLQVLHDTGWDAESDRLQASHYAFAVPAVTVTYANAHARASVTDRLCGFSFAATGAGGVVVPYAATSLARIFGTGNGVPPTSGINIVNELNPSGPVLDSLSLSPETGLPDYNADGAICLRNLFTGTSAAALATQAGINEVRHDGRLNGKPGIIVHGRADTLVPPWNTSRPYFGVNNLLEGSASQLRLIEVENANHFDAFIDNAALPGYDSMLVPLHVYFIRALDAMYARLKTNAALPPSQLVHTVPRGGTPGAAPAITAANVPTFSAQPAAGDRIVFQNNTVILPP